MKKRLIVSLLLVLLAFVFVSCKDEPKVEPPKVLQAPSFSLEEKTYYSNQTLTITQAEDADIYYTLDGSEPTSASIKYENPITVDKNTTVKAIAIKENWKNSEVTTATYNFKVANVSISRLAGTDRNNIYIDLITTTEGAKIYYTTDSSDPVVGDENTKEYTGRITINRNTTLKAIAIKDGFDNSEITTATYTFRVENVEITSKPGSSTGKKEITLSTKTDGATIYYTLDGSEPTVKEENKYSVPFEIIESDVIKAIAVKDGWNDSDVIQQGNSYFIGDRGPAGGIIFYDVDADNGKPYDVYGSGGNVFVKTVYDDPKGEDGLTSEELGWRYLEAAPSDLTEKYIFGIYRDKDELNTLLFCNTKIEIGEGKTNTENICTSLGDKAYTSSKENEYETTDKYAAKACSEYTITYEGTTYDDWFLPSARELQAMLHNLYENGFGGFTNGFYWSSSEGNGTMIYGSNIENSAVRIYFGEGDEPKGVGLGKIRSFLVRPVRAF